MDDVNVMVMGHKYLVQIEYRLMSHNHHINGLCPITLRFTLLSGALPKVFLGLPGLLQSLNTPVMVVTLK